MKSLIKTAPNFTNTFVHGLRYFSPTEWLILGISSAVILLSALTFGEGFNLALLASLIGVTSLTLNAKGNPIGQFLTVVFSIIYGYISYQSAYYGEMLTYLGMTAPMALVSMVTWMRNRVDGKAMEVKVSRMHRRDTLQMIVLTVIVTVLFYYVLRFFHTANLAFSTLSVTTSFLAAFMTYKRSPFYAIGYAANDVVLIILWSMMLPYSESALAMILCFCAFLVNDIYGFINWNHLYAEQRKTVADML